MSFARQGEMPESPSDRPLTISGTDQVIAHAFGLVLDLLANLVAQGLMEPPTGVGHPGGAAWAQGGHPQQQWGGGGGYSAQPVAAQWGGGGAGQYSAQPKVHHQVPYQYQAEQQYSPHAAAWGPRQEQSHMSGIPVPDIEMMLLVPDSHAGSLIGPKGANLKACRQAVLPDKIYISFAKPEDNQLCPETNGQLRPVTLRGPIQACTKVQGLLLEKLQRYNSEGVRMVCSSTVVIGGVAAIEGEAAPGAIVPFGQQQQSQQQQELLL